MTLTLQCAGSNDDDGTKDSGFDNDCADDGDEYDVYTDDGDEYDEYFYDNAISTNMKVMMLIEYGSDGIQSFGDGFLLFNFEIVLYFQKRGCQLAKYS